jgi:hypothetical protein
MRSCETGKSPVTSEDESAEGLARKYIQWYFSVAARFDEERVKTEHKNELDARRLNESLSLQNEVNSFFNRVVEQIPGAARLRDTYVSKIQSAIESKRWAEVAELAEEVLKKKFRAPDGPTISYAANIIVRLLRIADSLDSQGKFVQANVLDSLIKTLAN